MSTLLLETTDIGEAEAKEQSLDPGTYEVRLNLLSPVSKETLNEVHAHLLNSGVDVRGFVHQGIKGLYQVRIKFKKHAMSEGIAQSALLIPLIPAILIISLVGIGIFKIAEITKAITPILAGAAAFALATLFIIRKPMGKVATAYVAKR